MFYASLRIIFFGFFFVARLSCAAESSNQVSPDFLARLNDTQQDLNRQIMQGVCRDDNLRSLMARYKVDLPSKQQAQQHIETIQSRHPEWAGKFARKIHHLQNPYDYLPARFPSRIACYGEPGCEKSFTTLCLARICEMVCLFIQGSSVETSYRRSGSEFLDRLFQTLLDHPELRFLVVFDEFKYLAKYSQDEKDTSQHATVSKLWQCLDWIEKERHICVIGTDNLDPKEYEPEMQTRFFDSIFKFNNGDESSILPTIDSEFAFETHTDQAIHNSNEQRHPLTVAKKPWTVIKDYADLDRYKSSLSHLSKRELRIVAQSALEIAIHEKLMQSELHADRTVTIESRHFDEALRNHGRSFMQRILARPLVQQLCSLRALSYYLATASCGLRIYSEKTAPYGMGLIAIAGIINTLDSHNKEKSLDIQLFGSLTNITEIYQNHRRYHDSLKRQQDALDLEAKRYTQSRDDREADLERDAARYEQSRIDRDNGQKLDRDHYAQSRADREADLERDAIRYEQSRIDREQDVTRQLEQFKASQNLALRGQYLKHIDIALNALDQDIKAANSIEDIRERTAAFERLWIDFESVLLLELNNKQNESTKQLHNYGMSLIKEFYQKYYREMPATINAFIPHVSLNSGQKR